MIIIYHKSCTDGFCSAWVFHKIYPSATYIPVQYGTSLNDVLISNFDTVNLINEEIIIVDFSFKREELIWLNENNRVTVLDHHKTAQKDLEGLDFCTFNMNKSGARLAWEYLYEPLGDNGLYVLKKNIFLSENLNAQTYTKCPWLVDYTEDRDLWRFALPNSKEISAFIQLTPFEFHVWDLLAEQNLNDIVDDGSLILRYQTKLIEDLCKKAVIEQFEDKCVAKINSCLFQSEVGARLCETHSEIDFAIIWFENDKGQRVHSLRSAIRKDAQGNDISFDVSAVAKKYGGGGHKNAAGFTI